MLTAANASHDALVQIRRAFIESFTTPAVIPTGQFSADPDDQALVVIREGVGLVGMRSAPTGDPSQILWRITRGTTPEDNRLLDDDPSLAVLPASA